jgi:OmpA-OmpF porin, OOP family
MKNQLFILGLLFLSITTIAQTQSRKLAITAGFGFQQYHGDLGNGFYNFTSTEYGVASIGLDYYLNRSFDIKLYSMLGDFGFCSDLEEGEGGVVEDVLNSRMTMGGIALKYKIANGFLLAENSRLAPYIYAGFGINRVTDFMKMKCIVPGTYYSVNAGFGLKYNVSEVYNIGYNLNIGQFSSDKLDFIVDGSNDYYMQNSLVLGVNIFKK